MQCDNEIFAELFGLAIFDLQDLLAFKLSHQLDDDLLEVFTTSEIGDEVTKDGVIIPILGIVGDYYCIDIFFDENQGKNLLQADVTVQSEGWILYSSTGEITICGIGYLKKFDSNFNIDAKYIKFSLSPGWHEITIIGRIDENKNARYELLIKSSITKPVFSGDLNKNLNII